MMIVEYVIGMFVVCGFVILLVIVLCGLVV